MKIAVLFNPAHSAGDYREFLFLRAFHMANSFLKAECVIAAGKLCASPSLVSFADTIDSSRNLRKIHLPLFYCKGESEPENIPDSSNSAFESDSGPVTPSALLEQIRRESGELPDFSRPPHEFITVELKNGTITNRTTFRTVLPDELTGKLVDYHVHTNLAYCSENMTIPDALAMARISGLKRINFSEHSGQLYFTAGDYWPGKWNMALRNTPAGCPVQRRINEYEALLTRFANPDVCSHGFELDVDGDGAVALDECDRHLADVRLGAVHHLSQKEDPAQLKREFLMRTEALLKYGIDILAHPFRIFRWGCGMDAPEDLFLPVVKLLKQYGAAAELNFHSNQPYPEFVSLCIRNDVKLSLGSDSHNLYEVGFFYPHLEFLKELGVYGKLDSVLIQK